MDGLSCRLERLAIIGEDLPGKSSSCCEALETSEESWRGQVRNEVQVNRSHHATRVEANPDFLRAVTNLDVEGSGEVDSCEGERGRFLDSVGK